MLKSSEPVGGMMPRLPIASSSGDGEPPPGRGNSSQEQDRWSRIKRRLRTELGDDIFSSWFARMDLETVAPDFIRFSVPTRFLKSWIQAHYVDKVLACWQTEQPDVQRIELAVRSAVLRN